MATCVDIADVEYPEQFPGNSIIPLEGKSLVGAFCGSPIERDAIYWEHEGHRAVREGPWKLVAKGKMKDREMPVQWELYRIDRDRTESVDLSIAYPERVARMSKMWNAYAHRTDVFPCPKPKPNNKERKNKNMATFDPTQAQEDFGDLKTGSYPAVFAWCEMRTGRESGMWVFWVPTVLAWQVFPVMAYRVSLPLICVPAWVLGCMWPWRCTTIGSAS